MYFHGRAGLLACASALAIAAASGALAQTAQTPVPERTIPPTIVTATPIEEADGAGPVRG